MSLAELAKEWGWLVAIVLYFSPQIWKFFADRIWPERVHQSRRKEDRADRDAQAVREAEATMLKARIEREERESEARMKFDERMVKAIEGIQTASISTQQIQTTIQTQLTNYFTMTYKGIQDIKEGIEDLQDIDAIRKEQAEMKKELERITEPKIPKVGK